MNQPAQRPASATRGRWHNHLPEWVEASDLYARLPQTGKRFLQAVADACQPPGPDGSLVGAFGGHQLITSIGCQPSTFWAYVELLEAVGLLVTLNRGGRLTFRVGGDTRNVGNVYGIPGTRGALNARRCQREVCRMVRTADGALHRQVLQPGTQATLWHPDDLKPEAPPVHCSVKSPEIGVGVLRKSEWGYSENRSGGTPKIGVGVLRESESTILSGIPGKKTMVRRDGVCTQTHRKKVPLADLVKADLTNTGRLMTLFAEAVQNGLIDDTEARQLDWVGMAERAIRVARNPVKMFVSNIKHGDRWHFIAIEDEQAAQGRLKQYRHDDGQADDMEGEDPRLVGGDFRRLLIAELELEQTGTVNGRPGAAPR
jgi:hypothetical protein